MTPWVGFPPILPVFWVFGYMVWTLWCVPSDCVDPFTKRLMIYLWITISFRSLCLSWTCMLSHHLHESQFEGLGVRHCSKSTDHMAHGSSVPSSMHYSSLHHSPNASVTPHDFQIRQITVLFILHNFLSCNWESCGLHSTWLISNRRSHITRSFTRRNPQRVCMIPRLCFVMKIHARRDMGNVLHFHWLYLVAYGKLFEHLIELRSNL